MRNAVLAGACLLGLGLGSAQAQESARVISSTPVMQQVGVPRQVCTSEQVAVQPAKSGAGAAMGAIAGGAMGNAVGSGGGRAIATLIGVIGGAVLGDRIEGSPQPQVQQVQNCRMQTFLESRVVAYNVLYEYAGRQYTVQMPQDPGPTVSVQVTPVVQGAATGSRGYAAPLGFSGPVQAPVAAPGMRGSMPEAVDGRGERPRGETFSQTQGEDAHRY